MSGNSGARLALTVGGAVVGAVAGYFAGNPLLGAQLGATAGTIAGAYAFPEPGPEGPRLADLSVTASSYGEPIKIVYGTMRLNGNIIWALPLRERDRGGGKGMGGSEPVTYTYAASWAIAFAEGPVETLLRLWFDGKIVHDATQTTQFTKSGVRFRFYKGDEEQLPDAAIVADKGDETPAYRGICYIVFDDVEVDDYGRRIPQVTAEIAFKAEPAYPLVTASFIGDLGWSSAFRTTVNVDWVRGITYLRGQDAGGTYYLGAADLYTLKGLYSRSYDDIRPGWESTTSQETFFVGDDGYGYLQTEQFGADFTSSHDLVQVDLNTFAMRLRAATAGARPPSRFFTGVTAGTLDATGSLTWYVILQGLLGQPWCAFASDDLHSLGEVEPTDIGESGGRNGPMVAKPPEHGIAPVAYAFTNHVTGGGDIKVVKLTIADIVDPVTALPGQELQAGVIETWTESGGTFPLPLADMDTYGLAWYDPFSTYYFVRVKAEGGNDAWLVKWREDTGIVATLAMAALLGPYSWEAGHTQPYTPNGILLLPTGLANGREVQKVDLGSMQIIDTLVNPVGFQQFDTFWSMTYDGSQHAILLMGSGGISLGFYERATGASVALADVVTDLARRAGLGLTDIDVDELTDPVRGYALTGRMTVRSALEPLAQDCFFEGVESDGVLKFLKRGRAVSATVPQRDLGVVGEDGGDCWTETRRQDAELPFKISLTYVDPDRDYQAGTQLAQRAVAPVATMQARAEAIYQHIIVLSADEAKRIVERWLFTTWLERTSHAALLGPKYLRYDPGDVLQVQMDDGTLYTIRLHRTDVGADYAVHIEAFADDAALYASTATSDAGEAVTPPLISDERAEPIVVDTPLLRDTDYNGDVASTYYLSAIPARPPVSLWGGAAVYRSQDAAHWDWRATVPGAPVYGYALDALGDTASPFSPDTENTLRVRLVTRGSGPDADGFESITDLALVNGGNAALLGNEIIQFRDAEDLGNGVWRLSYLLRGRRGTDVFTGTHRAGERLLMLANDTLRRDTIEVALLNISLSFAAVARGGQFLPETAIRDALHGRDLKPYAPVAASRSDDAGDITLTWIRRTRLGGDWADGTGEVPLAEAGEAYDVDILDGPGGAVVRTLPAATASVVYTAAHIATDFGTPPATLHARICQRNAVIGRGFWYAWALADGVAGVITGKGE